MKKSNISRRDFLKTTALASIPLTLSGFPLFASSKPKSVLSNGNNDKILVLVQLQGGNDGLATIYDANQYANLQAVRSNIIIPENSIINFHNAYGFHPSMQGMKDIWDTGALGIVQNVGYPDQNRSHFRSTDIWNTASSAETFDSTGWIGRFYDLNYSDYPNGYPNSDCPHPFALTMGKIVSETCQGINSNYSLSLLDPFNPGMALVSAGNNTPTDCYGDALTFVNQTVSQTNAFAQVISDAANAGNNLSPKWDNLETELAEKLKNVARLISGGLQTKIYIVQLGGFDTHDNQVVDTNTTTGLHGQLLGTLSDALCAFQDDLNLLNIDDRVMGMTYSEFGRRIRSNGALGTDHGTAAPLFLFGSCLNNQIIGDSPIIDPQVDTEQGVAMQYDFRDIYGTILHKWLDLSESDVMNIVHPNFQILPLFDDECINGPTLPVELVSFTAKAKEYFNLLEWTSATEIQMDRFEIQRSTDARNWTKIGQVAAKNTAYHYTFEDRGFEKSINYYRLKQIDLSERFDYSVVRMVDNSNSVFNASILQNPVFDDLIINVESNSVMDLHIRIHRINGTMVINLHQTVPEGIHQILIPCDGLSAGGYFVSLGRERIKFIKR